jgi:hypothetical protein
MGYTEVIMIGGGILLVAAIAVLSGYLGAEKERRRNAEAVTRERNRDAEINVGPFVDKPASGMRPKKHLP